MKRLLICLSAGFPCLLHSQTFQVPASWIKFTDPVTSLPAYLHIPAAGKALPGIVTATVVWVYATPYSTGTYNRREEDYAFNCAARGMRTTAYREYFNEKVIEDKIDTSSHPIYTHIRPRDQRALPFKMACPNIVPESMDLDPDTSFPEDTVEALAAAIHAMFFKLPAGRALVISGAELAPLLKRLATTPPSAPNLDLTRVGCWSYPEIQLTNCAHVPDLSSTIGFQGINLGGNIASVYLALQTQEGLQAGRPIQEYDLMVRRDSRHLWTLVMLRDREKAK